MTVTVGVPVYNAEQTLQQCLENLAEQTYPDIKVIVLDNASTDGTGRIATRFAEADPRFHYRRQPQNRGARQNFLDVLALAETEYFMWRADDDLSDKNYIEEMHRLLQGQPRAALAVGRAILDKDGRSRTRTFPQRAALEPDIIYRIRLLLRSRPTWLFGLFRTEDLRKSVAAVDAAYKHVNAFDHLILFPFLVTMRVAGNNDTSFKIGYIERPTSAKKGNLLHPKEMHALRRDFLRYCLGKSGLYTKSPAVSAMMAPVLLYHTERAYRLTKIIKAHFRIMLGERPHGATTKYD